MSKLKLQQHTKNEFNTPQKKKQKNYNWVRTKFKISQINPCTQVRKSSNMDQRLVLKIISFSKVQDWMLGILNFVRTQLL